MTHDLTDLDPTVVHVVPDVPTVAELLTLYEQEYLPHQALNTQYGKRAAYRWLRQAYGPLPLPDLTPALLRQWRDSLSQRVAPGTVIVYLRAVSTALTVAVDDYEWLPVNPALKVKKPAMPRGRERFLDVEEQSRLLAACQRSKSSLLAPLVVLALTTGARKRELLRLHWVQVDLAEGIVRVQRTKTKVRQAVPMPTMTVEMLTRWYPQTDGVRVFPPPCGGRLASIDRAWYHALHQAQITDFHFHDLRHTAASYLLMSGCSLAEVAEILGHRSMETTKRYAHFLQSHTRALVERMAQQFIDEGHKKE
jgi:integrase